MKFCQKCGKEILDEAVVCPNCGCMTNPTASKSIIAEDDSVSVGLCVLSAFIPLFGLIYWAVKNSSTPKRAKACGITALVAWGASMIISCLFSGAILATLGAMF